MGVGDEGRDLVDPVPDSSWIFPSATSMLFIALSRGIYAHRFAEYLSAWFSDSADEARVFFASSRTLALHRESPVRPFDSLLSDRTTFHSDSNFVVAKFRDTEIYINTTSRLTSSFTCWRRSLKNKKKYSPIYRSIMLLFFLLHQYLRPRNISHRVYLLTRAKCWVLNVLKICVWETKHKKKYILDNTRVWKFSCIREKNDYVISMYLDIFYEIL